jgi:hypothetical protein
MKFLQTGTFQEVGTRGSWLRRKVRVLNAKKAMRNGPLANTRIP